MAPRIVLPPAGSIGDPSVGGAVLRVYNSAGLASDDVLVELLASGWSRVGGSALKGWRFKDRTGPIKSVVVKQDQITIKSGKGGWSYTLDEQRQGSVAVRLRLGNTDGWCANVPALAKDGPQPTAKSDHPGLFKGEHKAPTPETCPAEPGGGRGSASGAFLD